MILPNDLRQRVKEYCRKQERSVEYLNRALGFSGGYIQKFLRGHTDMSEARQEALLEFITREGN